MILVPSPSPESVGSVIRRAIGIKPMQELKPREDSEQINKIKDLLLTYGAKCTSCRHSIVVYHKDNICTVCGCVREFRQSKKGMSLFELYDMEAVQ